MQQFRHFWSNVQGFALAVLVTKLRQIATIRKKTHTHTHTEAAQWHGISGLALRFDLISTISELGVKVYCGQTLFLKPYIFI